MRIWLQLLLELLSYCYETACNENSQCQQTVMLQEKTCIIFRTFYRYMLTMSANMLQKLRRTIERGRLRKQQIGKYSFLTGVVPTARFTTSWETHWRGRSLSCFIVLSGFIDGCGVWTYIVGDCTCWPCNSSVKWCAEYSKDTQGHYWVHSTFAFKIVSWSVAEVITLMTIFIHSKKTKMLIGLLHLVS